MLTPAQSAKLDSIANTKPDTKVVAQAHALDFRGKLQEVPVIRYPNGEERRIMPDGRLHRGR